MTALIDLGKLTKPATVLIEKISDAVGGIARPGQIRRIAKAEADAEVIRATGRIEISELERRAIERLVRDEGRKQENIENITAKAIPYLSEQAKPEEIETDWISHFFERAKITSDDEMQTLWANILAGEANEPGRFSKRTIEVVATLGKADAVLFTKLCSYTFQIGARKICIFFHSKVRPYKPHELSFDELTHLDALGLIRFDTVAGFIFKNQPKVAEINYFGRPIGIELPEPQKFNIFSPPVTNPQTYNLSAGVAFFTQVGVELASVCGATSSADALDSVLRNWIDEGYRIWSPLES